MARRKYSREFKQSTIKLAREREYLDTEEIEAMLDGLTRALVGIDVQGQMAMLATDSPCVNEVELIHSTCQNPRGQCRRGFEDLRE
jgi:hypothetical protein